MTAQRVCSICVLLLIIEILSLIETASTTGVTTIRTTTAGIARRSVTIRRRTTTRGRRTATASCARSRCFVNILYRYVLQHRAESLARREENLQCCAVEKLCCAAFLADFNCSARNILPKSARDAAQGADIHTSDFQHIILLGSFQQAVVEFPSTWK